MKAMEARIKSLEAEVQTLKSQPATAPAAPAPTTVAQAPPAPAPQAPVSLGGAGGAAAKALNPDIAVIGDFLGAAGNAPGHATPALAMPHTQLPGQPLL